MPDEDNSKGLSPGMFIQQTLNVLRCRQIISSAATSVTGGELRQWRYLEYRSLEVQ